jgi:hypothetical protein
MSGVIEIGIASAVASGIYGAIGFAKARINQGEAFDLGKFGMSVLFGAAVGAGASLLGIQYSDEMLMGFAQMIGVNITLMNAASAGLTLMKEAETGQRKK